MAKALERLAKYIESRMAQEYGVFWSYKSETDFASLAAGIAECGVTAEESLSIAHDGIGHAKQWEEKARQNREKLRTALPRCDGNDRGS